MTPKTLREKLRLMIKLGYGVSVVLLLTLFASPARAESSVNVNVKNNVNTSPSNNARIENHIDVIVNGVEKVIDDIREGTSINSHIKVEAKSENGQTTINVDQNPASQAASPTANISAATKEFSQTLSNIFNEVGKFFQSLFSIFAR